MFKKNKIVGGEVLMQFHKMEPSMGCIIVKDIKGMFYL